MDKTADKQSKHLASEDDEVGVKNIARKVYNDIRESLVLFN